MIIPLLFFLTEIFSLHAMDGDRKAILIWANPRVQKTEANNHPTIRALQEAVLLTDKGIEQARKHLEDRAASCSPVEALDLADGRSKDQYALKLTALLHATRKEDPRGFVLQETVCNPQALKDWCAMLPQKPALHRQGWHAQQDVQHAHMLLAATQLPTRLKNQYMQKLIPPKEFCPGMKDVLFSPDGQYLIGMNNKEEGVLIEVATEKVLYTSPRLYEYGKKRFSRNGTFCFFKLGKFDVYSHGSSVLTTVAFDVKKRELVKIPIDCTTKDLPPVLKFSKNGRYAILMPEKSQRIGLLDTKSQEVVVKYPELKYHYSRTSLSPDETYFLVPEKKELALYDLRKEGQKISAFPLSSCNTRGLKMRWAPDSKCCLIPNCVGGDHIATYHIYYPLDNSVIVVDNVCSDPAPCFSADGTFCYMRGNRTGLLFDLHERKLIKQFNNVRIFDIEAPPAFFSEDPEYPYCVVPIIGDHGERHFTNPGLKVVVFNLKTKEELSVINDLKNVFIAHWPKEGPYYLVLYSNPLPDNFRSNWCASLDVRYKKTNAVVLHIKHARNMQSTRDGTYLLVENSDDSAMLVDMVTEQVVGKCHAWLPLANGTIIEKTNNRLSQIAPPDCTWENITSQQVCLILYALMRYHEKEPLDFTDPKTGPLRVLFESLDEYMQVYVAHACKIKM